MPMTLTNAIILDLDPIGVTRGGLRIVEDKIVAAGAAVAPLPGDETLDCRGAVVLPGLVNGHMHLYSALATGMPQPSQQPTNFREVLERVWWRLDRALDPASIEISGTIGALDALHCGTTTMIDHHASPDCIAGSLDMLEKGIDAVGLRSVLCYETTDRNGAAGAAAGIAENRRYLEKCAARHRRDAGATRRHRQDAGATRRHRQDAGTTRRHRRDAGATGGHRRDAGATGPGGGRFAAMVGAHAAFTLSDDSLKACAELAAEFDSGVHIHVAEDPCDDLICREQWGAPLVDRLTACGILGDCGTGVPPVSSGSTGGVAAGSILAHGTHFSAEDAARISARVAAVAHNPRSNMNNRVGYTPVASMTRVLLGTDGIGSDMFTESKHAWFKACDAKASFAPADFIAMLAHGARVAGKLLGITLGRLTPGAAADVVVTDYQPATPVDEANAAGHFIFALGPQHVRQVMIAGHWALRDRVAEHIDEAQARDRAASLAPGLWARMQAL